VQKNGKMVSGASHWESLPDIFHKDN